MQLRSYNLKRKFEFLYHRVTVILETQNLPLCWEETLRRKAIYFTKLPLLFPWSAINLLQLRKSFWIASIFVLSFVVNKVQISGTCLTSLSSWLNASLCIYLFYQIMKQ
jgi:hypothetical protein